ncbi:MAG: phenylalanine--tRNA ligase subunit alpha [Deltaproteobacteria bacterium]|jgi:phenylalanyl-tRNA synthetase alpha chain|nr:phenylalanine--tRNA ligase subunit alpha [Deltaproteobacteria bacterium]
MGDSFQTALQSIRKSALSKLAQACTAEELNQLRIEMLGRKGKLTHLLRSVRELPPEERRQTGEQANTVKQELEAKIEELLVRLHDEATQRALAQEQVDITLPGTPLPPGRLHPITQVMEQVVAIFTRMGFQVAEGPQVELDYYNFEALNIPRDHPARDMHDTFYFSDEVLLRTHTSPVQIRVMERSQPPIQIIAPGAVYRRDSDISHTPLFHQVEGLMVDVGISFAHLKGVLTFFVHEMFGEGTQVRFRPSFFPFTEPSAEVDIGCVICQGKGCRVCKGSGWLEILGAGMVDPEVFRVVGYDPEEVTGFAFGMGIERIAMLKYGINDIRLFFTNDLRFLRQF